MFISNPDACHGFTGTHVTVKKLLNNGKSVLIQSAISGEFILRTRIHTKASRLTPVEFKECKKENDSTALNVMFKAQPSPETLTLVHRFINLSAIPVRPPGQPRTAVQYRIQTQFPTTTLCLQNQSAQRNYVTYYGCMVRPLNRLIKDM